MLGLKFAYSTTGESVIEHDYLTGKDSELTAFPSPEQLWQRLSGKENDSPEMADRLLTP